MLVEDSTTSTYWPESGVVDHGLPAMAPTVRGYDEFGETPRPLLDPLVSIASSALSLEPATAATLHLMRANTSESADSAMKGLSGVSHTEVIVPGFKGAGLTLSMFRTGTYRGPGFMWIHGGGMIAGNRFTGLRPYLELAVAHSATVLAVEYRLAPEHPAPIPVEDCYSALGWVVEHTDDLDLDSTRLVLAGGSAGGGLAAGVALLARDRGLPRLAGLILESPMLDDRNNSVSTRQFHLAPSWSGLSNEYGWAALLGKAHNTDVVSPYDAPARAPRLDNLPAVHVAVGSADPFRDECVAFASAIWRDGGDCELHVLPGGNHGFETSAPLATVSQSVMSSRRRWIDRVLSVSDVLLLGEP